jgi:hypothetical protein
LLAHALAMAWVGCGLLAVLQIAILIFRRL